MACALFSDRTADGRDAAPVLQKMRLELRFKVVLFYGKPPPLKGQIAELSEKGTERRRGGVGEALGKLFFKKVSPNPFKKLSKNKKLGGKWSGCPQQGGSAEGRD